MILFAQRVGFGLLYGLLPVAVSSVLEFHLAAVSILAPDSIVFATTTQQIDHSQVL